MRRNRFCGIWLIAVLGSALALLVAGCKTSYYRKAADKEIYGIIEQAEKQVFGTNRTFTIETPYSDRKPEEILAMDLVSERQKPDELFLTIEDALNVAVNNSREYQSRKEQLYLTALSLSGERYTFRPRFFANPSLNADRNSNGERLISGNSRIGVTQALQTGGSIGATIANDFLRYYTGDPRKSVVSSLSVNLVQPLLRGAGKRIAAENLKQAERNVIYAIRTFSQYQRQFSVDIVIDFFNLLQNKDQLRNAYDDYKRRLDTIQYTEARGEAGVESQLDVDQARTEELTAKNSYVNAATIYLNNLDSFKITLGLPLTTNLRLDDTAMKQLEEAGLSSLVIDPDKAFQTAIDHHLELLNEIDRFEDSKRKIKVSADRLKADLNILADASLDSDRPTDYTSFDFDDVRVGAGIQLNLPFDRLRERNNYRATLVSFESEIRSLSLQLDNKKLEIARGFRDLERLKRSYDIQKNQVEISQRWVEGEQLSLQAGRRTLLTVRTAQDSLVKAQNLLTAAMVGHLGAKLQLLINIGVLNTDIDHFWSNPEAAAIEPSEVPSQSDEIKPPDQIFGQLK